MINISPSRYLQYYFQKEGINVSCIPNFINIQDYPFLKRSTLKPKILWVRTFHKIYNVNMAARVLHRLLQKYPDAELCMVGGVRDGSLDKFKLVCQELGITDKVRIAGYMIRKDWTEISKSYDIFINTTFIDNTPMSVIETMALGLPVVSTNVGGIPFLLDNNVDSLLVQSDNDLEMCNAIERLLEDQEFADTLIKSARKKAESFDWYMVKSQWDNVLYSIYKN
jgi:glycosyltransferase involved in cell wall biosynthesis